MENSFSKLSSITPNIMVLGELQRAEIPPYLLDTNEDSFHHSNFIDEVFADPILNSPLLQLYGLIYDHAFGRSSFKVKFFRQEDHYWCKGQIYNVEWEQIKAIFGKENPLTAEKIDLAIVHIRGVIYSIDDLIVITKRIKEGYH
jgi:hypothetical protein